MGIEAFKRWKISYLDMILGGFIFICFLYQRKCKFPAWRLDSIVAVGIIRQYIFYDLWWRDGLDCLKSKYYLQLHLRLFPTSNRDTHVLRSYFCHFPRGGNDFRTHTFRPAAGLRSAWSRVGGGRARPYVKCCCSRRRRRLNKQFISSLGYKVQSGSTKLQIETAMPLHVAGFCTFQNANNTKTKSKHCIASIPSIEYPW